MPNTNPYKNIASLVFQAKMERKQTFGIFFQPLSQ